MSSSAAVNLGAAWMAVVDLFHRFCLFIYFFEINPSGVQDETDRRDKRDMSAIAPCWAAAGTHICSAASSPSLNQEQAVPGTRVSLEPLRGGTAKDLLCNVKFGVIVFLDACRSAHSRMRSLQTSSNPFVSAPRVDSNRGGSSSLGSSESSRKTRNATSCARSIISI